jgi:hypothetical protein
MWLPAPVLVAAAVALVFPRLLEQGDSDRQLRGTRSADVGVSSPGHRSTVEVEARVDDLDAALVEVARRLGGTRSTMGPIERLPGRAVLSFEASSDQLAEVLEGLEVEYRGPAASPGRSRVDIRLTLVVE